ncbi:MAG: hypothetical protein AB1728_15455, partial [Bacteroidota bacterium]
MSSVIQPYIPDPPPKALLLIGAGASYGSNGTNLRPPLGINLFDELCKYSEYWSGLPSEIKKTFKEKGFEEGFDYSSNSQFEKLKSTLIWHMAFYFDRFFIDDPKICAYV